MRIDARGWILAAVAASVAVVPCASWAQSRTVVEQGTLTADTQAITSKVTWNSPDTLFTHWKIDVTDMGSQTQSRFFDFQVGGVSKVFANKLGGLGATQLAQILNGTVAFYTWLDGRGFGIHNQDWGNDEAGPTFMLGNNQHPTNPNPGSIWFTTAQGGSYYLWVSNAGDLRIGTAPPAGSVSDTSGTAVGSQTSSRDAKNIDGLYTDYDLALKTVLRTNLYSFTYKNSDFPDQRYVGLITDESPEFGHHPDEAHPNGRALNVVNSVGYLMAAIKAQQAQIEALRRQVERLQR